MKRPTAFRPAHDARMIPAWSLAVSMTGCPPSAEARTLEHRHYYAKSWSASESAETSRARDQRTDGRGGGRLAGECVASLRRSKPDQVHGSNLSADRTIRSRHPERTDKTVRRCR